VGNRIEIDGLNGTSDEHGAGWMCAWEFDDELRAEVERKMKLEMTFTDAVLDTERASKLWEERRRTHGDGNR